MRADRSIALHKVGRSVEVKVVRAGLGLVSCRPLFVGGGSESSGKFFADFFLGLDVFEPGSVGLFVVGGFLDQAALLLERLELGEELFVGVEVFESGNGDGRRAFLPEADPFSSMSSKKA